VRITKVHIENYRSLKNFTFEPGPYCVLIGENNAGKSNILRALNLVLGEAWPTERNFSEEDFYNQNTNTDIVIQVYFDKIVEEWRNNFPVKPAGFELRCHAYKRKTKGKPAGSLTTDYVCIDEKGSRVRYPAEKMPKGERYSGVWLPLRVTRDLRETIPFLYVDVLRDYNRQTPSSRWSVLRRLFNEVNTEFLNDKKTITVVQPNGEKAKMTRKDAFAQAVKDAYKYLRTPTFERIEQRLAVNAMEHMGLDTGDSKIELHFDSHDPTNAYKSLQLYVEQLGIESPAGEVGAGLQSAIVVAIFRTYEEMKREGAIFAIEEPEVFLHPQKARYFESVLQRLAKSGNQIFLTTHSPVFVQVHRPESVAIIRRTEKRGSWACEARIDDLTTESRQMLRLLTEFDTERKELFFAKAVMLVEGNTEKVALPLAFHAMGADINRLGISIVEVGGKTKFSLFARVLGALGIPYVILADHDIREIKPEWNPKRQESESQRNAKHAHWNTDIESVCTDSSLFWLRPDFEAVLGLPKNESEKIDRAFETFMNATAEDIPDCLRKPIEALLDKVKK